MLAWMEEDVMTEEDKMPESFHEANTPKEPEPIKADTANVTGPVQSVEAREVNVNNGGIGVAKGEVLTVTVNNGGIGAMAAGRADVHIGSNGGIGAIAAQEATLSEQTTVGIMAALQVNGNPKVLFDLRAGLLAGVVAGFVFGILRLLTRHARH